jgi:hypothetical protein
MFLTARAGCDPLQYTTGPHNQLTLERSGNLQLFLKKELMQSEACFSKRGGQDLLPGFDYFHSLPVSSDFKFRKPLPELP